jgi:hypothetical protein
MNFAFLLSSIGSLIFSTISPIAPYENTPAVSNSTHNVTNTIECYGSNNYIKLDQNKNISDIFKNCTQNIITCNQNNKVCGVSITQIKYTDDYRIVIGCIRKKNCFTQQPSLWKHLDYDIPTPFRFSECCEGDKCNQEENLAKTQKLLTTKILYPADHDKLCPEYSNNHQSITLQPNTVSNINIAEGSNLLLTIDKVEYMIYKNQKSNYTGSIWYLLSNSNNRKLPLFSFDKAGKMHDYTNKINSGLIKNNKIFYVVANSIHICNFTQEDEARIQHIDRMVGTDDVSEIINIIVAIPAIATTETTSSEYTTKNNSVINKYIIFNNAILIIISFSAIY